MRDKVRLQQIKSFRGSLSTFAGFFFPRTTIYTGGLPLARKKRYEVRGVSSHLIFVRERDYGKRERRDGEQRGLGGHPENENSS